MSVHKNYKTSLSVTWPCDPIFNPEMISQHVSFFMQLQIHAFYNNNKNKKNNKIIQYFNFANVIFCTIMNADIMDAHHTHKHHDPLLFSMKVAFILVKA